LLKDAVESAIKLFAGDNYQSNGDREFRFEVRTDRAVPWRAQTLIYATERFVEFNIFATDDLYSEDRREWVAELASRMTDNIPAGAFVFRYDEGDVRLRVVRTFRESESITPEAIVSLLETTAFPLKLWQRAFSYRHDPALSPQDALEAALVAEEAYDGSGLSAAATRAIMRAQTAQGTPFADDQPTVPAFEAPVLRLVEAGNEGSDSGENGTAAESDLSRLPTSPPDEHSTFSRLMNTRVAQEVRKPNGQVAAVVVFNSDVTEQDANELLFLLSDHWESADVQEFKPEYGRPVLWFA
jgi:hypothetical protein